MKLPADMGLPKDLVWKVVKPLYGIPENALYWYHTYLTHEEERLNIRHSIIDPFILMHHDRNKNLEGLVAMMVDYILMIGTQWFQDDEECELKNFKLKERKPI